MKSKLFIILFLLCASYANAQYIIAGQHNANDYYYKYTPDNVVISIPAYQTSFYVHYFSLDVNNDGIMDFKFGLIPPGTALGGDMDYCLISGLNNNKVALAYYDSCISLGGVYGQRYGMAYKFNYNDTINANANWDSLVYLSYYYNMLGYNENYHFICGNRYGTDTAYIGLRVQIDSLYTYGWIKIAGLTFSSWQTTTLTMGTFACENYGVGIKPLTNNKMITVYPNPVVQSTLISLPENLELNNITLDIFDVQGKIIKTISDLKNHQYILSRNDFNTAGVYFVRIKSDKYLETVKLLVQ